MILPDVNVLVHAFRSDSSDHHLCRNWLDGIVNGDSRYGTSTQVLSGVIGDEGRRAASHLLLTALLVDRVILPGQGLGQWFPS